MTEGLQDLPVSAKIKRDLPDRVWEMPEHPAFSGVAQPPLRPAGPHWGVSHLSLRGPVPGIEPDPPGIFRKDQCAIRWSQILQQGRCGCDPFTK